MFSSINYLTIRSMEHAFGVRYTKKEIEHLLKILKEYDDKNKKASDDGRYSTQTRSKI